MDTPPHFFQSFLLIILHPSPVLPKQSLWDAREEEASSSATYWQPRLVGNLVFTFYQFYFEEI